MALLRLPGLAQPANAGHAGLLLGHGTIMMGVCALAWVGPLLRVFRVEPTDVLRDDG